MCDLLGSELRNVTEWRAALMANTISSTLRVDDTRSLTAAVLAVLSLMACTGCAPALKSVLETYPSGRAKVSYSYYVDSKGKKVLQGAQIKWPSPGGPMGLAMRSVYEHGKLIEGSTECAVNE